MSKQFEDYLVSLPDDQYDALILERIQRLNDEQRTIALAREEQRKLRAQIISKLTSTDSDVHEHVFNLLRDMDGDECEHGRSYVKHCIECGEIDHKMFPELFDKDGYPIEE